MNALGEMAQFVKDQVNALQEGGIRNLIRFLQQDSNHYLQVKKEGRMTDFIRPRGCFPDTKKGWRDYEAQWDKKEAKDEKDN